jgi:hypothetical protein
MKKILAAVLLALPLALSAQPPLINDELAIECTDSNGLGLVLDQFKEILMVRDNESNEIRYSLWVNPTTRTWTFVQTRPQSKTHCVVAFGQGLEYSGEF